MEDLKQLLERMFRTRELKTYTHHEGHQGVITIRFKSIISSHFGIEQAELGGDQNTPEYHATFKQKTKSQMDRDRNRSVGFISHYNTRSRNTTAELPRHPDYFHDNFIYSKLSPDASIFTPSFVQSSDHVSSSPVSYLDQNRPATTLGDSETQPR